MYYNPTVSQAVAENISKNSTCHLQFNGATYNIVIKIFLKLDTSFHTGCTIHMMDMGNIDYKYCLSSNTLFSTVVSSKL